MDQIPHTATVKGQTIRVRNLTFDADSFTLPGLKLLDYNEVEERELVRLGMLTERHYAGCIA